MTNNEISKKATKVFNATWGECVMIHLYLTLLLFMLIAVYEIFMLLSRMSLTPFEIIDSYVPKSTQRMVGIMLSSVVVLIAYIPAVFMVRRYYIGLTTDALLYRSRQYFMSNLSRTRRTAILCFLITNMLKFMVLTPAILSSYIVYRCAFVSRLDDLSTFVLIVFMLSLGFTIVWAAFWLRYCISLTLAKYIVTLSPKINIFDACDLSRKIMDSKTSRYVSFWLYNSRYLLCCLLIFPSCIAIPYVRISYIYFVRELLGPYWQDKYPLMIERWQRRAAAHI